MLGEPSSQHQLWYSNRHFNHLSWAGDLTLEGPADARHWEHIKVSNTYTKAVDEVLAGTVKQWVKCSHWGLVTMDRNFRTRKFPGILFSSYRQVYLIALQYRDVLGSRISPCWIFLFWCTRENWYSVILWPCLNHCLFNLSNWIVHFTSLWEWPKSTCWTHMLVWNGCFSLSCRRSHTQTARLEV